MSIFARQAIVYTPHRQIVILQSLHCQPYLSALGWLTQGSLVHMQLMSILLRLHLAPLMLRSSSHVQAGRTQGQQGSRDS
jgi:hypothetical protein